MNLRALLIALSLGGISVPALAAPRLAGLSSKPVEKTLGEVEFTVTIERPTPLDIMKCEVSLDPGDGGKPLHLTFDMGGRRSQSVKHVYQKAGTYKVKAEGAGSRHCEGTRQSLVIVNAAGTRAAATPRCPPGWSLAENSVKGERYTCRADPPAKPLACAGGTKYFSGKGEIGCR